MPPHTNDHTIDELAEKLMKVTRAESKTAAIRAALIAQLEAHSNREPLRERIKPILERGKKIGPNDPDFDMKSFTDEMWDER